ncbi:Phosphoadenosine phosphosulfate reductase family protein [Streptomyces atratus]|uniref:Phosphoadenosine phosphosulfate reductase family protein n=1 Tax=Streptomyces atratus TaxID=1893 RepID=A0A1K2FDK2_STRAR|nr:Phosphoadenosine phosphosulfate reductase family protein [Streptomyces atratus]
MLSRPAACTDSQPARPIASRSSTASSSSTDIWQYIAREEIELPSIYYAHKREVFRRDDMWLAAGDWGGPKRGETAETRLVRYRTVGDMSCTGAVDSRADTVEKIVTEIAASRLTERGATRADDRLSETAMEDR